MTNQLRILHLTALVTALGCGDSTGETGDSTSGSTSGTTEAPEPTTTTSADSTTTLADTGQTETTAPDSTGSTSLDSTDGTTGEVLPDIEVSIDGRALASGDLYSLAMPVDVGGVGDPVFVTVENVGGADLALSAVSFSAGATAHFLIDDSMLDGILPPGASTSFAVGFAPTNGGRKLVEVSIDNDDPDESPYSLVLEASSTPNTWRNVSPTSIPSARFNAAMAGTPDGRVLLFGGRTASGMRVNDTWLLDVEAGDWTELVPPEAPSARDASAMAWVGGDTFVLFGGNQMGGGGASPLGDTWLFDVAAGTWTELTPPVSPSVRFQHAMVTLSDGLAILQGGRSQFAMEIAETWQFDGATQEWTDLTPAMDPGPRSAFGLASNGDGTVVMVGGSFDSSTFTDETWVYDAAGNTWTMGSASLGARFNNAAAWLDGDTFVSYSGKITFNGDPVPGTWGYDAAADTWTDLAPAAEPAARFSHRLVSVGGNKAIMFGGLLVNADFGSASAATWEYVGP